MPTITRDQVTAALQAFEWDVMPLERDAAAGWVFGVKGVTEPAQLEAYRAGFEQGWGKLVNLLTDPTYNRARPEAEVIAALDAAKERHERDEAERSVRRAARRPAARNRRGAVV